MDPRTQILRLIKRPRLEFSIWREVSPYAVVLILVPVRADKPVPEVFEAELVVGATAAQGFEVGGGAVAGGSLDVDEIADGAAVGEGTDLGADHVVE